MTLERPDPFQSSSAPSPTPPSGLPPHATPPTGTPSAPTPVPVPAPLHSHHDEEEMVCYCFHVPLHKIEHFIRRERPAKVSMISHCLGAGTGCGSCVWDLKDIYKRVMAECAAEDAAAGRAPQPLSQPPPPPPTTPGRHAASMLRRHSPSIDLGPVFAPIPVPTPILPLDAASPPVAPPSAPSAPSAPVASVASAVPAAPPPAPAAQPVRLPVSAESTPMDEADWMEELNPADAADTPPAARSSTAPAPSPAPAAPALKHPEGPQ